MIDLATWAKFLRHNSHHSPNDFQRLDQHLNLQLQGLKLLLRLKVSRTHDKPQKKNVVRFRIHHRPGLAAIPNFPVGILNHSNTILFSRRLFANLSKELSPSVGKSTREAESTFSQKRIPNEESLDNPETLLERDSLKRFVSQISLKV